MQPFGAGLICILPKKPGAMDLGALVQFLNGDPFRSQYTYAGRFRIGQRLLSFAKVPIAVRRDAPHPA
tara:strand:+ start:33 stop:236 length:204 start_codon:yes stop_codon:yes gene_type:complete